MTAVCSLCLGGGTHSGFLGDAILQLVALPLLLISIRRCFFGQTETSHWWDLGLCACLAAIPVLQVIPLPPSIWTGLPSRRTVLEVFTLIGQKPGWMPISLLPDATASAALSLIPPFALFWGTRQLGTTQRRYLVVVILLFACFSVFFGMVQLASGQHSRLRLFDVTNVGSALGFFANSNHFAALLYVAFLFASPWAIDAGLTIANARKRDGLKAEQVMVLMASVTLMFLLAAAQIMTRSRAGAGLTLAALFGVALLTMLDGRNRSRKRSAIFFLVAIVAILLFTAQLGLSRLADRLAVDPLKDARVVFAQTTIEAAKAYFPFGSGVGTFPSVYPLFEKPGQLMANTYANHAHDDYLEFWLESGAAGIGVLILLAFWFVWRSIRAWLSPPAWNLPIDNLLARATTIAIALLGVHSLVDYPLRTSALMSLMAISCALLTNVPVEQRIVPTPDRSRSRRSRHRHAPRPRDRSDEATPEAAPASSPSPVSSPSFGANAS